MKIKFDSSLGYQQEAIRSIVDIFRGQEKCEANFTVYSPEFLAKQHQIEYNEIGYANTLTLTEGQLLSNVQDIQLGGGLKPSLAAEVSRNKLDFTIEMETGTGKTYVYLRTIMELYRRYGFAKHIIVVPSIPIKEGVFKSLQMTEEHFRQLYDNVRYNYFIYNSSDLSKVRDFAVNDTLEIMVINIDAFRKSFENPDDNKKKANIIHRYNDKLGYKPLDLIKNTRPVVFIDEPQSTINTPLAKKAVASLNPLALVRYSATHREKVNVMYKLDAVAAYEKKLVKQIEVGSVQTEGAKNQAYIRFLKVKLSKGAPQAQVELDVFKNGTIKREKKWVKQNDPLEDITGREEYEGYIIKDIHAEPGSEYIDFTSRDEFIKLGEAIGAADERQIKRTLIAKTIQEHLDKELVLNPQGIKVLSLFFIDSVAKYRVYDEEGNQSTGEYGTIFEEEYLKLIRKPKYVSLFGEIKDYEIDPSQVHNGYFSIDKKSKASNKKEKFEVFKDTKGNSNADEDTYNLIMRKKEELLSFSSKLRFIFSHSALKEGWDNPNVFQVCVLRDGGGNEFTRRQQLGRGLRLCVNQSGDRVYGHDVNTLTVMATENYAVFADELQKEIEKDTGIRFGILEDHSFSDVVLGMDDDKPEYLGQEQSEDLFNFLMLSGYIDTRGKVQDKLRLDLKNGTVELPEAFKEDEKVEKQILAKLKGAAGKLEIKNQDDKKRVKVNRTVLNDPKFKALWNRIKHKTTYSVNFDSNELIRDCVAGLDEGLKINRGKLIYEKAKIGIRKSDVAVEGNVKRETSVLKSEVDALPDIVSYLQNETQLTRKSIVKILTQTNKLRYFKVNPQKFIEGCIEVINQQMRLHIIDGIKYKKISDAEFYSQELFENEELFGYLKSNLKESKRSPYEYVVYDSDTESKLVDYFENSGNIEVYAKLPSWFKIDTPLGSYNPDWAVFWKDAQKEQLFFVVESKGSTNTLDLRGKEERKIECGKKHFEAIGSKMIVAKDKLEIEEFGLSGE